MGSFFRSESVGLPGNDGNEIAQGVAARSGFQNIFAVLQDDFRLTGLIKSAEITRPREGSARLRQILVRHFFQLQIPDHSRRCGLLPVPEKTDFRRNRFRRSPETMPHRSCGSGILPP